MCRAITARTAASFLAAFAYSVLSPCAWLVPAIRTDLGDPWRLRRLHDLAYYGAGPLIASMAVLPVAIWLLYAAMRDKHWRAWAGACLAIAATVLFNAFGATIMAMVALSMAGAARKEQARWTIRRLAGAAAVSYGLILPLLPPSTIAAIARNSPTVGGDFRLTARSFAGILVVAAVFVVTRFVTRKTGSDFLRFLILFAALTSSVAALGTFGMYMLPQRRRYELAIDMAWCVLAASGAAELLRGRPKWAAAAGFGIAAALLVPLWINVRWARTLIRAVDMTKTDSYRIARWFDENMPGRRVMLPVSYSFQFNMFWDSPQLFGGHDTMLPNFTMRVAQFTIYSGMNAGSRDGEIAALWLKALGARAVTVPGLKSSEFYKPFANPRKFEGLLPALRREGGDTIYGVPGRSDSLAHAIPAEAAVRQTPAHGLDTTEIEKYVNAPDDAAYPEAAFDWRDRHSAHIRARVGPGQLISVQETYHPGWRAYANGAECKVMRDGLEMILVDPGCRGECDIALTYGVDAEGRAARVASAVAGVILACTFVVARRVPRPRRENARAGRRRDETRLRR